MDRRESLISIAQEALKRAERRGLDSDAAALLAVGVLRDAEPELSEHEAFLIVWNVPPQ